VTHVSLDRQSFVSSLDTLRGRPISLQILGDSIPISTSILQAGLDSVKFGHSGDGDVGWIPTEKILSVDVTERVDHTQGTVEGLGIGVLVGAVSFTGLCAATENKSDFLYIPPIDCGVLLGAPSGGVLGAILGGIAGHHYITRYQLDSAKTDSMQTIR